MSFSSIQNVIGRSVVPLLVSVLAPTLGGCTANWWFGADKSDASTFGHVDWVYMGIWWICLFFFALITFFLVLFVIQYRRTPTGPQVGQETHSTALEITWTAIPSVLLVFIFFFGFVGYLDMTNPPRNNVYEVRVHAYQWGWYFTHPNGIMTPSAMDDERAGLHLPAGQPVVLVLSAEDVMHSFYVPAFRTKMDCVPGRYNRMWFEPKAGKYTLQCTEYCGVGHSLMNSTVWVLPPDEFKKKLDDLDKADPKLSPVERGAKHYQAFGCAQCHSIDGSAKTGPTWKGLYGRKREFSNTSEILDPADPLYEEKFENYIRESIYEPAAKVVSGYPNAMGSYKGRVKEKKENNQMADLIAYIKSLK